MTITIIKIPNRARLVLATLENHGYPSYLAGGIVRDSIIGRVSHDIDIVTAALPEQVTALFPHHVPDGKAQGVIKAIFDIDGDSEVVDIATMRKDGEYLDGPGGGDGAGAAGSRDQGGGGLESPLLPGSKVVMLSLSAPLKLPQSFCNTPQEPSGQCGRQNSDLFQKQTARFRRGQIETIPGPCKLAIVWGVFNTMLSSTLV